jgi:choline dehydrogenase-like flavoprotein
MIQGEADLVIAGGGAAGCVLAARLSEDAAS